MKFKILNEKNSPLLKRRELDIEVGFEGATPKKDDLKKELSGFLKSKDNVVVVKHIYTNFGGISAKAEVFVYQDVESLKNIERVKEKKEETSKVKEKKETEDAKEESKEQKA